MQINANITGIQYQILLAKELETIQSEDFDINGCPVACIYADKKNQLCGIKMGFAQEDEVLSLREGLQYFGEWQENYRYSGGKR